METYPIKGQVVYDTTSGNFGEITRTDLDGEGGKPAVMVHFGMSVGRYLVPVEDLYEERSGAAHWNWRGP